MTRINVLVVDDSEISRRELRRLVELEGKGAFNLVEAESGEEGLVLYDGLDGLGYALVDVHLPGISGFKMLDMMRSRAPSKFEGMQVFMMCSDGPDHDHAHCHDHADSHAHSDACESLYSSWLLKPIDIALFRRFLVSDSRMRAMIDAQRGTDLHQDSLRVLFKESDHLTEKQIRALEYLVEKLTSELE